MGPFVLAAPLQAEVGPCRLLFMQPGTRTNTGPVRIPSRSIAVRSEGFSPQFCSILPEVLGPEESAEAVEYHIPR